MSTIGRRDFIAGAAGAMAWPLTARAQRSRMPVVGYLCNSSKEAGRDALGAFLKGLAETGYAEGRNVIIEYRWADERNERLPSLAAELVRRRVDVIAAPNVTAAALAAKEATKDIPIVFFTGSDPVEIDLVASLNRPGGNLTGVAILQNVLIAKRLELLHEMVPSAKLIVYLTNPTNRVASEAATRAAQAAAKVLGLILLPLSASTPEEIEIAFEMLMQQRADGLLVSSDPFFEETQRDQIVALAARYRVPAIYNAREPVAAGGLMGYGTDRLDAVRQMGIYTGRILKGEKPADLPVQQSVKIELTINTKTAKALGLIFPLTLLGRADEVIE